MFLILMQVMEELGLIGLRIQRMPNEPDLEFGIPSQYSYMTVSLCISLSLTLIFKLTEFFTHEEEGIHNMKHIYRQEVHFQVPTELICYKSKVYEREECNASHNHKKQ